MCESGYLHELITAFIMKVPVEQINPKIDKSITGHHQSAMSRIESITSVTQLTVVSSQFVQGIIRCATNYNKQGGQYIKCGADPEVDVGGHPFLRSSSARIRHLG